MCFSWNHSNKVSREQNPPHTQMQLTFPLPPKSFDNLFLVDLVLDDFPPLSRCIVTMAEAVDEDAGAPRGVVWTLGNSSDEEDDLWFPDGGVTAMDTRGVWECDQY